MGDSVHNCSPDIAVCIVHPECQCRIPFHDFSDEVSVIGRPAVNGLEGFSGLGFVRLQKGEMVEHPFVYFITVLEELGGPIGFVT